MRMLVLAMVGCLIGGGTAVAQPASSTPAALPRSDVHGVIGWQNLRKDEPLNTYNYWINGIFYGGAGAGWYWTEHVKTQVDVGAGTRGTRYGYTERFVNGQVVPETYRLRLRQTSVAVGQQYQFFRNQWFHPHAGAGLEIARETSDREYQPTFVFDPVTRVSRQVSAARHEPDHDIIARPFGEAGFKAYMSRRAFFSTDMRIMVRSGVDEVLFRFGFGVDF